MRIPGSGTPSRIISIGELAVKDGDKQEPPDSPVKHSNDNACRSEAIKEVARPAGFEPATAGLEIRCSVQLSYERLSQEVFTMADYPDV